MIQCKENYLYACQLFTQCSQVIVWGDDKLRATVGRLVQKSFDGGQLVVQLLFDL